jgi:hypothetical protein
MSEWRLCALFRIITTLCQSDNTTSRDTLYPPLSSPMRSSISCLIKSMLPCVRAIRSATSVGGYNAAANRPRS